MTRNRMLMIRSVRTWFRSAPRLADCAHERGNEEQAKREQQITEHVLVQGHAGVAAVSPSVITPFPDSRNTCRTGPIAGSAHKHSG